MMTTLMLSENMALAARSRVGRMTGIEPALSAHYESVSIASSRPTHRFPLGPRTAYPAHLREVPEATQ
jgi:hypothetical protein